MRQQQRMKSMTDTMRKIRAKGRVDANNIWWVSDMWPLIVKSRGYTQSGRTQFSSGTIGCTK